MKMKEIKYFSLQSVFKNSISMILRCISFSILTSLYLDIKITIYGILQSL